ncbi:MAG TPA: methyltransferase domain-containing protein [Thermoanaerobaculia bacterium]|nr:methyltransferase domain-containing protein [Thermoanaerobaculia bacterium]HQR66339.1 methyltransferase domain-containing protein [Thermoanaerobaculia bacterium]
MNDRELVAALRERSGANDSVAYAHRVFAETAALARRHGLSAPKSVLEIGPGANLGSLFAFAASGVQELAGLDVVAAPPPPPEFYETLRDFLMAVDGTTWWRTWAVREPGRVDFPPVSSFPSAADLLARIRYVAGVSSETLPFEDGRFDLVYSVAALEHVPDPAGTLAEMRRVLRPGGLTVHEIDLKHHGSADPLKFLEWTDEEWARRATRYGGDVSLRKILDGGFGGEIFCNRLRREGWTRLFREAGFALEQVEPVIVLDASLVKPKRFAPPFRDLPDGELAVLAIRVAARRP